MNDINQPVNGTMEQREINKKINNKIAEYMSEVSACRCMNKLKRYCLDCEINQAKAKGLQEAWEIING